MYAIEFSKAAVKVLTSMPRNTRDLIRSKIETLVGRPGYRLRIGDWRVIYTLDSGRLVVLVLDIGARGGIYQ